MINREDNISNFLALTELQNKVMGVVIYLVDDPNGYSREQAAQDLLEIAGLIHDLSGDFISPLLDKQKSPSESDQEQ